MIATPHMHVSSLCRLSPGRSWRQSRVRGAGVFVGAGGGRVALCMPAILFFFPRVVRSVVVRILRTSPDMET